MEVVTCGFGTYSLKGGNKCLTTPRGYMSTNPSALPEECTDGYFTTSENSTYVPLIFDSPMNF